MPDAVHIIFFQKECTFGKSFLDAPLCHVHLKNDFLFDSFECDSFPPWMKLGEKSSTVPKASNALRNVHHRFMLALNRITKDTFCVLFFFRRKRRPRRLSDDSGSSVSRREAEFGSRHIQVCVPSPLISHARDGLILSTNRLFFSPPRLSVEITGS
jgi:hypothetical protein